MTIILRSRKHILGLHVQNHYTPKCVNGAIIDSLEGIMLIAIYETTYICMATCYNTKCSWLMDNKCLKSLGPQTCVKEMMHVLCL